MLLLVITWWKDFSIIHFVCFIATRALLVTAHQHISFIFLTSFPYNTPNRLLDSLLRLLFPYSPFDLLLVSKILFTLYIYFRSPTTY